VHVKFECRECSFITTDGVEAQEHSDAERHGLEVLGEIQPRVGSPLHANSRAATDALNLNGWQKQTREALSLRFLVLGAAAWQPYLLDERGLFPSQTIPPLGREW
jgi:hypothetical protein